MELKILTEILAGPRLGIHLPSNPIEPGALRILKADPNRFAARFTAGDITHRIGCQRFGRNRKGHTRGLFGIVDDKMAVACRIPQLIGGDKVGVIDRQ